MIHDYETMGKRALSSLQNRQGDPEEHHPRRSRKTIPSSLSSPFPKEQYPTAPKRTSASYRNATVLYLTSSSPGLSPPVSTPGTCLSVCRPPPGRTLQKATMAPYPHRALALAWHGVDTPPR
ncbi:hypothetical protein LX36DRAFT_457270 [Colletotrichum falcatum]|nr:hypothetical protein LX36DRAFT_457270 [Colletotrichum falcatum]